MKTMPKSVAQISRIKPVKMGCGHYETSGGRPLTEYEYKVLIRMLDVPCKKRGLWCFQCFNGYEIARQIEREHLIKQFDEKSHQLDWREI